jgi:hypothetical protein
VYCNIIISSASYGDSGCSGTKVTVDEDGMATVMVLALGAVAIFGGSKIS